ncbi:MAG TPA: glutamine synthetase family protein [Solirubrobacteraceae bacterium]|jgi:glutamine synthetase|nr:glutamine synthetase family protein [Solirubrobacteraceae bacterium]
MTMGVSDLAKAGIRVVRLQYADLHGICRGKDIPVAAFEAAVEEGIGFVEAIMTVDLRHNVTAGFEQGFPDIRARPDLATLRALPWDSRVAVCICDLFDSRTGEPYGADPRGALRRVLAGYEEHGVAPVLAHELEFYLCEPDPSSPSGFRPYAGMDSPPYTVGHQADPAGVLAAMLDTAVELGLEATAGCHEYGRSQYEINMHHGEALEVTDRAFRFKDMVKELAARDGLRATFMGKPFNGDEGSGLHLHVSLADGARNACADDSVPDGLSKLARSFLAGVLEHAPAMMVFLNPTVNSYRRIHAEALVPTRVCWGHDHRMALVRVPPERGGGTRLETRLGDGTANPYLAAAALLAAGLDGIRRELEPPKPVEGFLYELPEADQGPALPTNFPDALDALGADPLMTEALGAQLVETFRLNKAVELDRFRSWVTDWEFAEYSPRL